MADAKHRRVTLLAVAVFILLLLLIGLNAFNLRSINPHTTADIFLLSSLSILVFLLFVAFLRATKQRGR